MDTYKKIEIDLGLNTKRFTDEYRKIQEMLKTLGKDTSGVKNFKSELAELRKLAEINLKFDNKSALSSLSAFRQEFEKLPKSANIGLNAGSYNNYLKEMNKEAQKTISIFDRLGSTMKHHLLFGASSMLLGGMIGIPLAIANVAKETEALTAKLRQNLELATQYHNNNGLLEADLKRLADIAGIYSIGFGESLPTILDSMQLLARRFKDVEQVSYLSSAALTMAKIDNVDLMVATQNLEAVMLQFQLDLDGTRKFLNSFTTAVHVSKISGLELLQSLQRAGSSFKQFNMDVDSSISAVAALATETSRTGSVLGNTFKSVAANFSMDKAIDALDAYGIKIYDVNEQGLKVMRNGTNVFKELMNLFATLDAEGQAKLALSISGGKYHINAMLAFLQNANGTFDKILNDIQTKSSDALTAQLLKVGLDTFQVKLMQLQGSLQVFSKTIGDEVLPNLKNITDGLTNGVMWLTENKESVAKLTSALVELGKVVIAYYIQQGIANAAVKEGTTLLRLMYLCEGQFSTAFYGMGTSLRNFGIIAASVTAQMAALYAAINIIQAMYDRFSDKSGVTGQQQDLTGQLAALKGTRDMALANSGRTGISKDEINRIYNEQEAELTAKLAAVNNVKKEQDSAATNKAMAESERAFKAIVDRALASATPSAPTIGNAIVGDSKSKSKGAKEAPDKTNDIFKLDSTRDVDHILKMAAIDADVFSSKLELLDTRQSLFGISTGNTADKLKLMHGRIGELLGTAMSYNDMAGEYESKANNMIAASAEAVEALDKQKISWSALTKEEKRNFVDKYKDYFSDYKLLTKLLELSDKLKVESAEAQKQAIKLGSDAVKTSVSSAAGVYDNKNRMLGYAQQRDILALGRFAPDDAKKLIELKYSIEQLTLAEQRLKEIEGSAHSPEDLIKQQVEVDTLKAKVEELADKFYTVREGLAGITSDILIQGSTLKQIWGKLWNDMANDAIKALFRVQNNTPGLLTQILGLFGGGVTGSLGGSFASSSASFKSIPSLIPAVFNAEGSIGNQQTLSWLREGNKREAVIPLEDHKERGKQLWIQSGKELGMIQSSPYVPYLKNPEIAKDTAVNVQVQQNNEHVTELREANNLMRQQNQMLLQMVNKDSNNGQIVVLPVAPSADQVSQILHQNPEIITGLLRKEQRLNRW